MCLRFVHDHVKNMLSMSMYIIVRTVHVCVYMIMPTTCSLCLCTLSAPTVHVCVYVFYMIMQNTCSPESYEHYAKFILKTSRSHAKPIPESCSSHAKGKHTGATDV